MTHYLNGAWVSKEDTKISVFDLTFLRGYGLFEFLRTYSRKPFMLDEHLERFVNGARGLGLPLIKSPEEIKALVYEGIEKNPTFDEVYVKFYLTGGITDDAMTPGEPSFIMLFLHGKDYPKEFYTEGIKLIEVEYERFLPEFKSLNYMAAVFYHKKAKEQGAQEVLFCGRDGNILEGSTINFFAIKNGKVYTASDDVLYGITRKFVLQVAKDNNIEVVLGDINKKDIGSFDEAFITSTTREVCPVVQIGDQKVGNGTVGPVTKRLIQLFTEAKKNL